LAGIFRDLVGMASRFVLRLLQCRRSPIPLRGVVAPIEFLEWTGDNHLRHTKFVALRDDKPADQDKRE